MVITLKYTHDYEDDTTLTYTDWAIVLTFTSEDPDYGTEVVTFHKKKLQEVFALLELASGDMDTEELQEQNEEAATLRSEYMTTSLYAWYNMLRKLKTTPVEELSKWMNESEPFDLWAKSGH